MEAKHTPGPWEFGINPRGGYSNGVVVRPAGEFPHGLWIADCGCEYDEERQANARLMASSPELLAACEKADQFFDHLKNSWEVCHHTQAMMDQIKAAIAKATGAA